MVRFDRSKIDKVYRAVYILIAGILLLFTGIVPLLAHMYGREVFRMGPQGFCFATFLSLGGILLTVYGLVRVVRAYMAEIVAETLSELAQVIDWSVYSLVGGIVILYISVGTLIVNWHGITMMPDIPLMVVICALIAGVYFTVFGVVKIRP